MYKLKDVKLEITKDYNYTHDELLDYGREYIEKRYRIKVSSISLYKKSIDNRNNQLFYCLSYLFDTSNHFRKDKKIEIEQPLPDILNLDNIKYNKEYNKYHVVVVGMGPSGLFTSLMLSLYGFKVTILERGKKVEERIIDVDNFFNYCILNPESNIQYGEGGAGTFSDGKLATGISSPYIKYILKTFVKFGAKPDILYDSLPHIGSDYLRKIVINFRKFLLNASVNICYNSTFVDFKDNVCTYKCNDELININYDYLAIGTGHSAVNTYEVLKKNNIVIKPKPFAIGVRMEVLQKDLDLYKYHKEYNNLPSSDFKFVIHLDNGRVMYSFCMCPGGVVVNASSEEGYLVVNGMSNNQRDEVNANSAVLINVNIDDYYKDSVFDGINFVKELEHKAYIEAGHKNYAICQKLCDFLNDQKTTSIGKVVPSIKPGYVLGDISKVLPKFVTNSLKKGFNKLKSIVPFFDYDDAILTLIETRSSNSIQVERNIDLSTNIPNVYVMGEASGYTGGITTSCIDGIKVALSIEDKCRKGRLNER